MAEPALARQQLHNRVLDELSVPVIGEARRKPADQPFALRHLVQQQIARVRALMTPAKRAPRLEVALLGTLRAH